MNLAKEVGASLAARQLNIPVDTLYTSALFDCFDNSCLGISISDNMRTELVINTYKNAKMSNNLNKITTHSDRGSQYTSDIFRQFLR